MIPRGSLDDFGGRVEGPPPPECWECPPECRFFHEAVEDEQETGHAVCEPKERLAEHACGCAVCVDQQALHAQRAQRPLGIRRVRVTWRR